MQEGTDLGLCSTSALQDKRGLWAISFGVFSAGILLFLVCKWLQSRGKGPKTQTACAGIVGLLYQLLLIHSKFTLYFELCEYETVELFRKHRIGLKLKRSCNAESEDPHAQKQQLLPTAEDYGLNGKVDEICSKEFQRLAGKVYVDHAGATLYSETQLESVFKVFTHPQS